MSQKRIDPDDGVAYTFEQLSEYYKGKYKKKAIEAYWDTCEPTKSKKAKSKAKAEPKTKAKAKAKTKAKAKVKAKAKAKAPKEKGPCPILHYFPFAGKGELSRLIAAAGGLEIESKTMAMADDRAELCKACGAVGTGLPVLEHGDHKMCQSVAIQNYLASIAPRFKRLPKQAAGVDMMWGSHLEDLIGEAGKSGVFAKLFGKGECKSDELKESMDKWLKCFENLVPADGFINGKKFPTAADCVVVLLFKAAAPFKHFWKHGNIDLASYPKLTALSERAAEAPGLKEYLASSASIGLDPFAK